MCVGENAVLEKLTGEGLSEAAVKAFMHNYSKLTGGESGLIPDKDIDAVESLPRLEDIAKEDGGAAGCAHAEEEKEGGVVQPP